MNATHYLEERIFKAVKTHLESTGITVEVIPTIDDSDGYYSRLNKEIVVSAFSHSTVSTLIHEAAHYLANHQPGGEKTDREAVAEGSAFVTLHHFKINTIEHTYKYLLRVAGGKEVVKRNLYQIDVISQALIRIIEQAGIKPLSHFAS